MKMKMGSTIRRCTNRMAIVRPIQHLLSLLCVATFLTIIVLLMLLLLLQEYSAVDDAVVVEAFTTTTTRTGTTTSATTRIPSYPHLALLEREICFTRTVIKTPLSLLPSSTRRFAAVSDEEANVNSDNDCDGSNIDSSNDDDDDDVDDNTAVDEAEQDDNAVGKTDDDNKYEMSNENDDALESNVAAIKGEEGEEESAAIKWLKEQHQQQQEEEEQDKVFINDTSPNNNKTTKRYVVVGAGWGGWGAAKALCESSIDSTTRTEVIILDTLPDPTGRKMPYVSKTNKPIEAGTRGFWKDYPNINQLCTEFLQLDLNEVFTDYTNSSFYSPYGLEATAPVFTNAKLPLSLSLSSSTGTTSMFPQLPSFITSFLEQQTIPNNLPSPLGQVLATFTLFERLPIIDRISMIGLLLATVDCLGSTDEKVLRAYDRMTAHELFIRFQLSERLVNDFIRPTLLVGLFKPPEELSALVVMELLYYYALAHTDSFDVRWIKNGTVSSSLIAPLATKLEKEYNLQIMGGCRVQTISTCPSTTTTTTTVTNLPDPRRVSSITYTDTSGNINVLNDLDGVVLAVTSKGLNYIVNGSPDLAKYPVFTKAASCNGIDVISVRLWLNQFVPTRTPANVFANFDALRGAGGTFFMLDQLQKDTISELWGDDPVQGSIVACDFYNAGALLALPDNEIVRILMEELLPSAVPAFESASVVDSWVGRYPGAVSWFAPGTFDKRPPLHGAGRDALVNLKCAGDWIRLGDREHGAKGLCQERAYVTGLEAANALLRDTTTTTAIAPMREHVVIPVRDDELQFRLAVTANREVMKYVPRFWVR